MFFYKMNNSSACVFGTLNDVGSFTYPYLTRITVLWSTFIFVSTSIRD